MKSGFIAVLGRPNAGKSSIVNALVGEKVSIVSPKAQTTRSRIMGIFTDSEYQMVFIDTPGIHTPKNELGVYMEGCIKEAARDADVYIIVIDGTKPVGLKDKELIEKYLGKAPVYVVVNKTDLCGYEGAYPILNYLAPMTQVDYAFKNGKKGKIEQIIPTSCKNGNNLDVLKDYLKNHLTDTNLYYDPQQVSDRPISFMIAEIIREKALWLLNEEIPHGIGVTVTETDFKKGVAVIKADIILEKDSHKLIVLGEGGGKLKVIGSKARVDIEKLVEKKVFLELFVKVRRDWRNKKSIINDVT